MWGKVKGNMTTAIGAQKKTRGRPKVFDREDALEKAMNLFWQHGYEGTSLSHLVAATGAKAPTLYAEFTNKEGLFCAVLEHYIARFTAQYQVCLQNKSATFPEALEAFLTSIARCFTGEDTPAGCFIVSTASGLGASSQHIADVLKDQHAIQDQTLTAFLQQRQQQGEIPSDCDTVHLAKYLDCFICGMAVSARDGVSYDALFSLVKTTMGVLPQLIKNN